MLKIDGYQIVTKIYESPNSEVYRAIRQTDHQSVILKVLKQDYPTPAELTRYKQEYELTRTLNQEGIVKAYGLEKYQNNWVMFIEDFGGKSLRILRENNPFSLEEFLEIAIKISRSLGEIHIANIIHKDINPANIVFNIETQQLKIIDFGISTRLMREEPTLKNPNGLEGTLPYISPEQTGRMNRSLDYRTDFYSLGVTFYELLTGKRPFETDDELELVHCHIAKQPLSPSEINPLIPRTISNIVMKLMAKNAEDRYQSAWGLKADLETCLKQLKSSGKIEDFALATQDISDKFQIPQKLYGREAEVEALLTAFERVANSEQSQIEMMLVAGYSGIGKSSLVAEIHKPNTRLRGYFTEGKFDQFQKSIPYSAVVNAFKGLVKQLLTESEAQLEQWRAKLSRAFGANGQVIIDVIPEVELIVGKQPPVPELGASEAQNRFNIILGNFIRAFCTKEHPLVIFLDDLQWADSATLKLIELMMTDTEMGYLFLIGAYRDNEVSASHPLMITVNQLQKLGAIINSITLAPLALENISQLIADTLYSDTNSVKPLAKLLMQKTGGNPFFVNQFLKTLHSENLITFDLNGNQWLWNIAQIEAKNITDNVVDLMLGKLKKLPEITQNVLRLAACIGASFSLNTLAIVSEKPKDVIVSDLVLAVQAGFILPASELDDNLLIQDYKFLHDRVQQAAYTLIADADKKGVHLKIGRLLQLNMSETEQEAKIFDLVEHLNMGCELITNPEEKITLAKFNLMAARKAKDSTAYLAARDYLEIGLSLLGENSWEAQYELTLELHKERAEVAYLNGKFDRAEELIQKLIAKCRTNLEKAEIYNILIVMLTMMAKYEAAIDASRQALSLFGIDLPTQDFTKALQDELSEVGELWEPGKINTLLEQPEMTNPEMRAALNLLVSVDPAVYFTNAEFYGIIAAKMAALSIKYGPIAASAKSYASYGIILSSVLQEYRSGYEFARLGVNISERFNDSSMKAKASNNLANHVQHWVLPMKEAEAVNNNGYQAGLESGELQFAGYITHHKIINSFFSGKVFSDILAVLDDYLKFTAKIKNLVAYHSIISCQLPIYNLNGLSPNPKEFATESLSEVDYIEECHTHKNLFALGNYLTCKAQVLYLYGDHAAALDCIQEAETMLPYLQGMITNAVNNFYYSLILVTLYPTVDESEQIRYQRKIETNQKQMKIWADNCPENFWHKYLLVEAEIARIYGKEMEALDLYDRAIASAQKNEYIQEEALANELAAQFWLGKDKEEIAKLYLKKAHYGYQFWGAQRKVEDLEQKYPQLLLEKLVKKKTHRSTLTSAVTSTNEGNSHIDLMAVIKASQILAGEIALDKLLAKLMIIVLENGGAQKGCLILLKDGKLTIEATGEATQDTVEVLQSLAVENSETLPVGMVQYVARTLEDVVLSDETNGKLFINEPYIIQYKPKSILCAPIINQGKLIGILYLENNLTTGAFTSERLEILKVLSSQAAISIENALLYHTLENKVAERTAQLAAANQEISTLNDRLKAENLRLSAELNVAKKLQEMVLPKPEELERISTLEIAGYMEPADEVGGDYYDVLWTENGVKIAIGDVTGHGLESGVLMLMVQTAVRTLQKMNETDHVRFLDILNQTLYDNLQRMNSDKNMTLAILDYVDGWVKLSGQHEEMIIVRADGTIDKIDTIDLGFPIGLDAEIADFIAHQTVQLNSQDVVILYTDGITEAENINQDLYGLDNLCQVVVKNRHLSAHEIRQCVIDNLQEFIGDQKVFDDITLVVLKQK